MYLIRICNARKMLHGVFTYTRKKSQNQLNIFVNELDYINFYRLISVRRTSMWNSKGCRM